MREMDLKLGRDHIKLAEKAEEGEKQTEIGTHVYCIGECKISQPLHKTIWRVLRKLTSEL